MDVFKLRDDVVSGYAAYVRSFLNIADLQIKYFVEQRLADGHLWPDALIQLNPVFKSALSDFLGAGYLSLLPKVIKANCDAFADLFATNGQVDDHFSPLIGLRNTLAHSKEAYLLGKLRASGEAELRWFAEKLGLAVEIVPAVRVVGDG